MRLRLSAGWLILGALATESLVAQPPPVVRQGDPTSEILVLGTFHFQDAGLDSYRPQFDLDVLSPAVQAEIDDILDRIEAFGPTRIGVERIPRRQAELDSLYAAYRAGQFELPANEIYQLGFKLAERLSLPGVRAIDARQRGFFDDWTDEEWERRTAGLAMHPTAVDWDARFSQLYSYEDQAKVGRPLVETLIAGNDPERVREGHGHYLVDWRIGDGEEDQYFGADAATRWYNRNLRIFSNIRGLAADGGERIVIIIGAGHLPILMQALESSPEFRVVSVEEVLGRTR